MARDEVVDLAVAVKVYVALDDRGLEEFKGEFKTIHHLNHPNLLRPEHYDVADGRPFLVMPLCSGSAEREVGRMSEGEAWRFLRDVASGLAYLHGHEVIHRDIKPDNILRDDAGDYLISDFGISTRMRSTLHRNSTRQGERLTDVSGTIAYMAPELFTSKPVAVKATDVWALGATLYELLTGELIFLGQGGILQLRGAEIPELSGDWSAELVETVRACLSREAWDRPMASELAEYAAAKVKEVRMAMPWQERIGSGQPKGQEPKQEQPAIRKEQPATSQEKPATSKEQPAKPSPWRKRVGVVAERVSVAVIAVLLLWGRDAYLDYKAEQEQLALEQARADSIRLVEQKRLEEEQQKRDSILSKWGMVFVEGGTFTMGVTPEQKKDAYNDEKPAHKVTLSDFYIGKHEVTQAQWRAVMGSNPSHFKGDNLPVENVSWEDCQEFIRKLNERTGLTFRLPTEAEWEYAARGGNRSRGYMYSGGDYIDEVAWSCGNSGSKIHPVGQKRSNELGLYDMSGHVWEWCSDGKRVYDSSSQTNPTGPGSGAGRVYRGGSWGHYAGGCRVSFRYNYAPTLRSNYLGLRLVLSL